MRISHLSCSGCHCFSSCCNNRGQYCRYMTDSLSLDMGDWYAWKIILRIARWWYCLPCRRYTHYCAWFCDSFPSVSNGLAFEHATGIENWYSDDPVGWSCVWNLADPMNFQTDYHNSLAIVSTLCLIFLVQWRLMYDPYDDERRWDAKITIERWACLSFRLNSLFYFGPFNSILLSWDRVFEVNWDIICTCLPALKAFLRRHAHIFLQMASFNHSGAHPSQSNKWSTLQRWSSRKASRQWPTKSGEE